MILNHKIFGEGEPLVILHGLFGSLDNWQTLGKKWAENYQVILVDLPNHGKSYHTKEFSYPQMAEAVKNLCEENSMENIFLLGHSMGGKTAIEVATMFPSLVKKLIVVDIAPRAYTPHHDEILNGLHSLTPSEITSRKEADQLLSNKIENIGVRLFLLKNLKRRPEGGFAWKMNLPLLSTAIEKVIGGNNISYPLSVPTLFVRGELSGYIQPNDYDLIEETFTDVAIETITNAGHWVHAEKPKELFELVTGFLKD